MIPGSWDIGEEILPAPVGEDEPMEKVLIIIEKMCRHPDRPPNSG
jgi:hypothetical protein